MPPRIILEDFYFEIDLMPVRRSYKTLMNLKRLKLKAKRKSQQRIEINRLWNEMEQVGSFLYSGNLIMGSLEFQAILSRLCGGAN